MRSISGNPMTRPLALTVLALFFGLGTMLLVMPYLPAADAADHSVSIINLSFSPNSITISPGDTVIWTNNDGTAHTVTGNNGSWGSGNLANGQTYSHTFLTAGDFSYHCSIHTFMTGVVHVGTSSNPPPTTPSNSGLPTSTLIVIIVVIVAVVAILGVVLMRRGKSN